jgi:hypothetical protein
MNLGKNSERLMRILGSVIALALMAAGLCAQEKHVQDQTQSKALNTETYIEMLRMDFKAQKQQIIKEGIQLDEKQSAAFWPIYREYNTAQTKLGDQKLAIIQDYYRDFVAMTDAKVDGLAHRVMELDNQRLALREKYYDILKKALPTVLVVRFFQLENQIQLITDLQIASNLPIIEEAPSKQ